MVTVQDNPGKPSLWQVFTAAPHRMMFLGGMVQVTVPLLWWFVELVGRYTNLWAPTQTVIPATWVHGYLMVFTLFPFFIFGFLMTTYPRWMSRAEVPHGRYVATFLLLAAGVLLFYAGMFTTKALLIAGVVLHSAGIAMGIRSLLGVYFSEGSADRYYETQLNVALLIGLLGELLYLFWLLTGQEQWVAVSFRIGLWLSLVPVLITVAHRMVPFFSSCVLPGYKVVQPRWSLPVMWAGAAGHVLLQSVGLARWVFLPDLALLAMTLHLSFHWDLKRSLSVRLLGALHIAFLGLSAGLLVFILQSLWLLATGASILVWGALHAVAIGFVAAMAMAMVTRVTMGHSGRDLVMDRFTWYCFLGIELAAVLRVLGDTGVGMRLFGFSLNVAAAAVWLLCLLPWAARFLNIYLRPRADGRPG